MLRRFISGRPVFTADREHIHHKLLQLGMSHRQVVIILYGVSAVFALLSLFLLWPTGSTLGLVMAVLGTGIWIGVQRLGYLEFGEIRRVAQRTMEQRHIFVNNLAIRRATEELKVAGELSSKFAEFLRRPSMPMILTRLNSVQRPPTAGFIWWSRKTCRTCAGASREGLLRSRGTPGA